MVQMLKGLDVRLKLISISLQNPRLDHLLELSHQCDSNQWSNIGFGEEITQVGSMKVNEMHLIWNPGFAKKEFMFCGTC